MGNAGRGDESRGCRIWLVHSSSSEVVGGFARVGKGREGQSRMLHVNRSPAVLRVPRHHRPGPSPVPSPFTPRFVHSWMFLEREEGPRHLPESPPTALVAPGGLPQACISHGLETTGGLWINVLCGWM